MATNVTEKKTRHCMRSSTFCKKSGMQLITLLIIQTKKCTTFTTE